MKVDQNKLADFIAELRALEIYTPLRAQGYMTSDQVCEACEVVENKIEELVAKYF